MTFFNPYRLLALWIGFVALALPVASSAQRNVHWQINPNGFPERTSVFVDVEEGGAFRHDLRGDDFSVSMDQFAGEQGGWILNKDQVRAGVVGAQVLVLIDKSRSWTGEFSKAQRVIRAIINGMDPARDEIAIASTPASGQFKQANLEMTFTADKTALNQAVDRLSTLSNNEGARFCEALAEGLSWFPETTTEKYRAVIFLSAGADKGEGEGDCVKESYEKGLIPYFPITLKLDRKYDDPRQSHKIENAAYDLAKNTGGRSIFRESEDDYLKFVELFWNRVRSQFHLLATFPCYQPQPETHHGSVLKVQGKDVDGIKFRSASQPAPTPQITALYPASLTRQQVDDGADLTVDGQGFCQPKAVSVGGIPVSGIKSHNPYRVVAELNSNIETGAVKVCNVFGQCGDSPVSFVLAKPPKGAEAFNTLVVLVMLLVLLGVLSVVLVAMRSRKARIPAKSPAGLDAPKAKPQAEADASAQKPAEPVAKTMALSSIKNARVEMPGGKLFLLRPGLNTIGREAPSQILLPVTGVSREHARFTFEPDKGLLWLEDLGSTNGTFYGPPGATEQQLKKLERKQLVSSGDTVWIGGQKLTVKYEGETAGGKEG